MYFFSAGNLEESCLSSPATCLSKGQTKLSTWMDFYALASPVFSKSVRLQICAQFKQLSQSGECLHRKLYLFYIQLLVSRLWGIYFIFLQFRESGLKQKKKKQLSLSHCWEDTFFLWKAHPISISIHRRTQPRITESWSNSIFYRKLTHSREVLLGGHTSSSATWKSEMLLRASKIPQLLNYGDYTERVVLNKARGV